MNTTGFCAHPSPGSHAYCDSLVKDDAKTVKCACACHDDMAPFEEFDARLREHNAQPNAFSMENVTDDEPEAEIQADKPPVEKPKRKRASKGDQ